MEVWEKPLPDLNDQEWESLCDGCGLCCLFHHPKGGRTNIACKLLDTRTGRCSDYPNRQKQVQHCAKVTRDNIEDLKLPDTCAYRLRRDGKPLPEWHYLISGDREEVHRRIKTARGAVSEVLIPVGSIKKREI